jgi:hypothetical protein
VNLQENLITIEEIFQDISKQMLKIALELMRYLWQ